MFPTPKFIIILQMMSCLKGPLMSAAVARVLHLSSNSKYGFMVTKLKICRAPSMKERPEQVVDAQGAAGRCARRVAPGAWEEASDLVVVEDAPVAVVGDSYLIGRFHVGWREA